MKRLFLFLIGLCWTLNVWAQGTESDLEVPEKTKPILRLIFEDRELELDLNEQEDFIYYIPQHVLKIGRKSFPLDIQAQLPEHQDFFNIETEFHPVIAPEKMKQFFQAEEILHDEKKNVVKIIKQEEGDGYEFEGAPKDGFRISEEKFYWLINEAIRNNHEFVHVPAEKTYSRLEVPKELQDRGIKEIISLGESNFSGSSASRIKNIHAASKKFNGKIIPQGGEFSFNDILESVSWADGFVPEFVIKGNDAVKEMGGGTCQVSTTVFRAAYHAGLPITSRKPHSYAVPYYKPHGLDAAIYLGSLDLKFVNDSPGDILIQVFDDEETSDLTFVFYGTKDDREVSLNGPFISNYRRAPAPVIVETENLAPGVRRLWSSAHDGFRSEWTRTIKKPGQEPVIDTLISNYRPWPAKILKGKEPAVEENQTAQKDAMKVSMNE